MPVFSTRANINKETVLECLGYVKDRQVPAKITAELDRLMVKMPSIIEAQAVYQRHRLADIQLTGSYISQKLGQAEVVITAVATLGSLISHEIERCFAKGNLLGGMLLDIMANSAIRDLTRLLRLKLIQDYTAEGKAITKALYPGTADWPIEEQSTIFNMANGGMIGVELNANTVMTPSKSVSVVFGAGSAITHDLSEDECADCGRKNCTYRKHSKKHQLTVRQGREQRTLEAGAQETVLEVLARNGIAIASPCAGHHTCGKCRVVIENPGCLPPTDTEAAFLSDEQIRLGGRLACVHKVTRPMTIRIDQEEYAVRNIAVDGLLTQRPLQPCITQMSVTVPAPSLENQHDDAERLLAALELPAGRIPLSVLKALPELLRGEKLKLNCIVCKNEIVSASIAAGENRAYGLAIDIGTTTVVIYLVDLVTGEKVAYTAAQNPQRLYGADVISRIDYTLRSAAGLEELRNMILTEINQMIDQLCLEQGVVPAQIYDTVAVGNTVMLHLFLGLPCAAIARAPYTPVVTACVREKAGAIGINVNMEGYVTSLPSVSGFVGADVIAGIIACDLHRTKRLTLLIDIGTNGEIVLGNQDAMICCSTAAGPAFEGAKITCGMGGAAGAIDHVWCNGRLQYSTINGKAPKGICGSGLVDIVAELLRYGIINNNGKMLTKDEAAGVAPYWLVDRITDYKGRPAFSVVPENGIMITQGDIRELQLAKGAIIAGVYVLCETMKVSLDAIEQIYLAGGFGSFLSVENAMRIGLLPAAHKDKIHAAGNSAGAGAIMTLLSNEVLMEAEMIKNKIVYTELAGSQLFAKQFMKSMSFKKENDDKA